MLPNFPQFSPINSLNLLDYHEYTKQFPLHCDYSPNNLMVWLSGYEAVYGSWLNGNLVLRISGVLYGVRNEWSVSRWMTIIGNREAEQTLRYIYAVYPNIELRMVPDYFAEQISDTQSYEVLVDGANTDYILRVDNLMCKVGKDYTWYRRRLNRFTRDYGKSVRVKELNVQSNVHTREVLNALDRWYSGILSRKKENDEEGADVQAIQRLFNLQRILHVKHSILGLYINGYLEGFTIYHIPYETMSMALGNHTICNKDINGAFDYLLDQTVHRLHAQGIQYLNSEQDMGLEGIRYHKSLLKPVMFHKRYTIRNLA